MGYGRWWWSVVVGSRPCKGPAASLASHAPALSLVGSARGRGPGTRTPVPYHPYSATRLRQWRDEVKGVLARQGTTDQPQHTFAFKVAAKLRFACL